MIAKRIAAKLCKDVVRRVVLAGNREYLTTSFRHPDGDFINVYVSDTGAGIRLSDQGAIRFKMRTNGMALTEGRQEFIDSIVADDELQQEGEVFFKTTSFANLSHDFIRFCEAMTRLSTFGFVEERRNRSAVPDQVELVMRTRIESQGRIVERNWSDPRIDPNGLHQVDYHVNTSGPPRNLFVVTTRERSATVSYTCLLYRSKGVEIPALAIIDPDGRVTGKSLDRLRASVDLLAFGVQGHEDDIVSFATGARASGFLAPDIGAASNPSSESAK